MYQFYPRDSYIQAMNHHGTLSLLEKVQAVMQAALAHGHQNGSCLEQENIPTKDLTIQYGGSADAVYDSLPKKHKQTPEDRDLMWRWSCLLVKNRGGQ